MVVCAITNFHPEFVIPGLVMLGSAITFVGLSWFYSKKTKKILPKGYEQRESVKERFTNFSKYAV